ncbi:hypothetical protein C8R44DRAFT_726592 [Mycena epipterygia]|nr:hypothetical protein C8R44DRAFT_726592 [Mycena epipterygia]
MSQRRMAAACGTQKFTIFIMGLLSRSLSVVVSKNTTIQSLFEHLESLGFVSTDEDHRYYFTHGGRKIAWTDTMESLGIGPISHLFLKLVIPGGAKRSASSSPTPQPPGKRRQGAKTVPIQEDDDDLEDMRSTTKPKAPTRSQGGATAHSQRKQRTNGPPDPERASSPPSTLHAMPTTPVKNTKDKGKSRATKVPKFSPRTARGVEFAMRSHLSHAPQSDNDSSSESDDSLKKGRQRKKTARPLNKVKHLAEHGWKRLGSSHTTEIYETFEQWRNDYSPHVYETAEDLVEVKHLGHPVDRPMDIRARAFILQWITPDCDVPKEFAADPRPVFRTQYRCRGNCSDLPPSDDDQSDGYESDAHKKDTPAMDNEAFDSDSDGDGKKRRKRRCPQKVILHIEVYSNNLSKAIVYQRNTHWEAAERHLGMSQHIRQCIMEYASLANMTAGRIKRRLTQAYKEKNTPLHRRPTPAQVENIVTNIRRKERLDTDPLKSIGIFAAEHPDKIFGFRPVDMSTNPPSKFATGIKSVHALQSLLLWAFINGLGLDSCWRHKNENRAPVTFITTIDQNNRMLPGPVYLSANVTAETLEVFLREVKELVEEMAEDLLSGKTVVHPSHARFTSQLMKAAERVRENGWNWVPLFVMIDKSAAELKAISAVWPDTHAILRWDRDHDTSTARPKLSRGSKDKLLHAVRELQRCRRDADWEDHITKFEERIRSFTDAISWTDMGLPRGRNRDTISTNNWTERAFKTFDQIFLENRANKSAYRLVMIIANEWFAYYENWQLDSKKVDSAAFKIAERGHRLWNSGGAIIPMPLDSSGRRIWRVANPRAMMESEEA